MFTQIQNSIKHHSKIVAVKFYFSATFFVKNITSACA